MKKDQETIPYGSFWRDLKSGRFASMIKESAKGKSLMRSSDVFNVMRPMILAHDDVECLYCIFLNAKNRVLAIEKMFSGTICQSAVYPREIVKRMLQLKSAAIVIVHNHPSEDPEPSEADFLITKKILIAASVIQATLHEHVIIGGQNYYSFADNGQMDTMRRECESIFN